MANPNPIPPPMHTRWKKGDNPNPNGARESPEIRAVKNLTKKELVAVANLIIKKDVSELKAMMEEPGLPALHHMLIRVVARIAQYGDVREFNILLDRLIGKVREEVLVTDNTGGPRVIVTLPSNGRDMPAPVVPALTALQTIDVESNETPDIDLGF